MVLVKRSRLKLYKKAVNYWLVTFIILLIVAIMVLVLIYTPVGELLSKALDLVRMSP
jgi:predicted Co/Zn/Cd cation transporter (cation efflux family)